MDFTKPKHSPSKRGDSFTPRENERLGSLRSLDSNAASEVLLKPEPTQSVQTLPRGLVREMISLYSSKCGDAKEPWRAKPHPRDSLSRDAPSQSELDVFEPTECKLKRFVRKIQKPNEDPTSSVILHKGNNKKYKENLEDKSNADSQGVQKEESEEKMYTSRTTITKTDAGARLIIDITFEQDAESSAATSESHVVTHSPESRILNEEHTNGPRREGDKYESA